MMVIRALQRGAAKLANDPNGHHVIQYCLLHFDNDFNQVVHSFCNQLIFFMFSIALKFLLKSCYDVFFQK